MPLVWGCSLREQWVSFRLAKAGLLIPGEGKNAHQLSTWCWSAIDSLITGANYDAFAPCGGLVVGF